MSITAAQRRRDERLTEAAYAALIATPFSTPTELPADGDFAVKSLAGNIANATALTLAGYASTPNGTTLKPTADDERTIRVPVLAVNAMRKIGRLQKGAVVTMATGFELWLHRGQGRYAKVGEP